MVTLAAWIVGTGLVAIGVIGLLHKRREAREHARFMARFRYVTGLQHEAVGGEMTAEEFQQAMGEPKRVA